MSITSAMASLRRTGLILSAVVAVVVVGGVGIYLAQIQASARDKLREDFAQRAALASKLTGGALSASEPSDRAFARRTFGGPERTTLYITAGKSLYRIETKLTGYHVWPPRK